MAADPLDDLLGDLDGSQVMRLQVRTEKRRYGKTVTVITGADAAYAAALAQTLKRHLATGGAAKEGQIELPGDHVVRASAELRRLGHDVTGPA